MKILLTAVNAKYIHSNLAVYDLKAFAKEYAEQIEVAEYTINNQMDDILSDIFKRKPNVICFSCYIWNIEMVKALSVELKKVLPETPIWYGGPEVSYEMEKQLMEMPYAEGIMYGEGEETFKELVEYYIKSEPDVLNQIKGIVFRKQSEILVTEARKGLNMDDVPFPYDDIKAFSNKILYYETSRGCPYSCSYCLSSIEKGVRFRSLDKVKRELMIFLEHKVPQVKFIDRTFNCNHQHAMEIWSFLHQHDNGITNFHFEISADILREDEITLLNQMRPGLVQLEIGVQSTNLETIKAINRKMDFNILSNRVNQVNQGKNIHQHLDLIAGLPNEDLNSFKNSFNQVYGLKPNQLQLGFLKVLKGAPIYYDALDNHIVYKSSAPYEVLYTKWLSYEEVLQLKQVEDMVEVYYNSGQFEMAIAYLEHFFDTPFALYEALGSYYEDNHLFGLNHSRIARYELLRIFFEKQVMKVWDEKQSELFAEILVYDLYLRENLKSRPVFARDYGIYKEQYRVFYEDEERVRELLPGYADYSSKRMSRVTHMEYFSVDIRETVRTGNPSGEANFTIFDYEQRCILDNQAKTIAIPVELR
ncbi:B12-binding domain-containing radical SAM protein [Anaeromicropila populeti]|uniref:Radical SAM superfamily enzyme YgiQ, UPF0313 family n=1 Tax=Anaeromicropila populeti TaxID=37658 RepID=A0A1I6IYG4_9FIRM|nr:B12-binding domain-containing radical SAM protein [Anaeromicropila populeti]SFR71792.1 Radical SAM superfamily enzyme YgiQ, UPF0313 family [Anaeromicropila populeti]